VPIGGAIGERASWRIAFWINLPVCIICIIGLTFSLRLNMEASSLSSKLARIDYLGIFVFAGAATSFLLGLTMGGTQHPWVSPAVIAPLVCGIVGFGMFAIIEWKFAQEPMMPMRIFRDRTSNAAMLSAFFHGLSFWALAYYLIIFCTSPLRWSV
jgi:MFS family permease